MPAKTWRDEIWQQLDQSWDLLIVGGGITGAGILREAARLGLTAVLFDQRDFAWGTSSRSSKLVHGGLRYLKEGKLRLTRDSVREREHLLAQAPGLVEPLGFLLASYDGERPGRFVFGAGLTIYDLLALRWSHRYLSSGDFRLLAGQIAAEGLEGGYQYGDAQTDDARLVLRLLQEARADGARALNYARAQTLLRDEQGQVCGATLRDLVGEREQDVRARVVINATGAWADRLRTQTGAEAVIRPLRGSHLVFPGWRLPVAQAVSFLHPQDQRPVFLLPWEGVTLVGTTDADYSGSIDQEPAISPAEVAYLMAAVEARYPLLGLTLDDVLSTFAGVRPVIGSGKENPSQESRDHIIWHDHGLITVTGGKLTTFRLIAAEVLAAVRDHFPDLPALDMEAPVLEQVADPLPASAGLEAAAQRRLRGRYGRAADALVAAARSGELQPVTDTETLWAELRWAARAEAVIHLEDLLLRRVRLGITAPQHIQEALPHIRAICQEELGWSDEQWEQEARDYQELWACCYSLPARSTIPDWRARPQVAIGVRPAGLEETTSLPRIGLTGFVAGLAGLVALLALILLRRSGRGSTRD